VATLKKIDANIKNIRTMLTNKKSEIYAIKNTDLAKLPDSSKDLYIEFLYTIIQYKNRITQMQMILFERMINGMNGNNKSLKEYGAKALRISKKDLDDFLIVMKEEKVKYYFVLDGLLLIKLGTATEDTYEYFSELIEIFGINKDDLNFISLVAKAVLLQQPSCYDAAKEIITANVSNLDFSPYVSNFYHEKSSCAGNLTDLPNLDLKKASSASIKTYYNGGKAVIESLNIHILENVTFSRCDEVILKNCVFWGNAFSLYFEDCQRVSIENCRFSNFEVPVFVEKQNIQFTINDCVFSNCYALFGRTDSEWKAIGGVIFTDNPNFNAVNTIKHTKFLYCGAKNSENWYSSAVISNCRCVVSDCDFEHCWGYHKNDHLDPINTYRTLFLPKTMGMGNRMQNSADFD